MPLDPDVLPHINLTTGQASGAGAGMLKNVTNLQWPFAMQDASVSRTAWHNINTTGAQGGGRDQNQRPRDGGHVHWR